MTFEHLDKGDKHNIHVLLYDREVAVLDQLATRFNCSRAAIVGELIRTYGLALTTRDPAPADGAPRRRRSKSLKI